MKHAVSVVAVLFLFLAGCKNDPSAVSLSNIAPTTKGVYILNEGDFNDPVGAKLTFYDPKTDSVFKNVYETANNNQSLGNLGDDMILDGTKLYTVMSGSDEVKILDVNTNKVLTSTQLNGDDPHDLCLVKNINRLFVTRLYKNSILVLNATTLAVVDSISVGANPLGVVLADSLLFVCNSGYGSSNSVSVINVNSLKVTKIVQVGFGPSSAQFIDGKIYVVCAGNPYAVPKVPSAIYSISAVSKAVVDTISIDNYLFGNSAVGPDGKLYVIGTANGSFFGGPIHQVDIKSKIIAKNYIDGVFYGMAIDETNGNFYLGDVRNFATDGEVFIYTKTGTFLKKFSAQKGPAVFAFKR